LRVLGTIDAVVHQSWEAHLLPDDLLVLTPRALGATGLGAADLACLPVGVSLVRKPLDQDLHAAARSLMAARVRAGEPEWHHVQLWSRPAIRCGWTDGIVDVISWFVPLLAGELLEVQLWRDDRAPAVKELEAPAFSDPAVESWVERAVVRLES
jgi:hypothetical protein